MAAALKAPAKRHFLKLLLLTFSTILFWVLSSCSLADEREMCCNNTLLRYRYVQSFDDEYTSYIYSTRHFLFDEKGTFMRELEPEVYNKQLVRIPNLLNKHKYTVITLANLGTVNEKITDLVKNSTKLNDFKLEVDNLIKGNYSNIDRIFWNEKSFEADYTRSREIVCDIANIHCQLDVRIRWNKLPPFPGDYQLYLENAAIEYNLNPAKTHSIELKVGRRSNLDNVEPLDKVVHTFPFITDKRGSYMLPVTLNNLQLIGEFVTLRFADNCIPTLRVKHNETDVMKPIDLSKAFMNWGWRPTEQPEQKYRIDLEIFEDGKVVVKQWAKAEVLDWINGGAIGVAQ